MPGEPEPGIIVINGFSDLMPETFTGDNTEIDVEEFFNRLKQWEQLHAERFHNDATKVGGLKYIYCQEQHCNGIMTFQQMQYQQT